MIQKKRRAARERPPIRWFGGKFANRKKIIAHFPPHSLYVEPYGGGASVLLSKPPCTAEIYNDLDQEIVHLFRVLRDPDLARQLIAQVELTPYAHQEFDDAYQLTDEPVERARRMLVRAFMGYGTDGALGTYKTGFRGKARRGEAVPAQEWANYPVQLRTICARIQSGVGLENIDAIKLMKREDGEGVLFYVDPPYLPSTRSRGNRRKGAGFHVYNHEMSEEDHVTLLEYLRTVKAMVVLSGYPSELYEKMLPDWHRTEFPAFADGGRPRTEVLWLNPTAWTALEAHRERHGPLFDE